MIGPAHLPHGTNLVGLPTGLIASVGFNDAPAPLHIAGVREMNDPLFEMLAVAENLADASEAFLKYMVAVFGLELDQRSADADDGFRRPFRASFLRLLIGWGYDSSSPEAAVLGRKPLRPAARLSQAADRRRRRGGLSRLHPGAHGEQLSHQFDLRPARPAL